MNKLLRYLKFLQEITGDTYYILLSTDEDGEVYYWNNDEVAKQVTLFKFNTLSQACELVTREVKEAL